MKASQPTGNVAAFVADRLESSSLEPPWDVYGQRIRNYEVHFAGPRVEMVRFPLDLEAYGIRVLRQREDALGVGFAAGSDLSSEGIRERQTAAEGSSRYGRFPAQKVDLPNRAEAPIVEIVDARLWSNPTTAALDFAESILEPFADSKGVVATFGAVRAALVETSVANSEGLVWDSRGTLVRVEVGIKAFGGPEGPPPGEYWVDETYRRIPRADVQNQVASWCRRAADARAAGPTPNGLKTVLLPPEVIEEALTSVFGFRLSGAARLREMAPPLGDRIASESISVSDDGLFPWSIGSSPADGEGTPHGRRHLIRRGEADSLIFDVLHGAALNTRSTGNGERISDGLEPEFARTPAPRCTTLDVSPGTGGTDEELIESTGEGLWVDQLGWGYPDRVSGAFGGEIRLGYVISQGKRSRPVRGGTVGGVVFASDGRPSLLGSVAALGSRPRLVGRLHAPVMATNGMSVGGAA